MNLTVDLFFPLFFLFHERKGKREAYNRTAFIINCGSNLRLDLKLMWKCCTRLCFSLLSFFKEGKGRGERERKSRPKTDFFVGRDFSFLSLSSSSNRLFPHSSCLFLLMKSKRKRRNVEETVIEVTKFHYYYFPLGK